jgi:mRNA-degrading endonuclease YafQ of YafQ-DinJ toxin-antitoxin module
MKIIFSKKFQRMYNKLSESSKDKVDLAINNFERNQFDPALRNHKLQGKLKNFRLISAANDLRILFYENSLIL